MPGYYHLHSGLLAPGSTILPGNYGRIIRAYGWKHDMAFREMALEDSRAYRFPHRPSRLDAAFVFLTVEEARNFRQFINGFREHLVYRVSLCDPGARSHSDRLKALRAGRAHAAQLG